MSAAAAPSYYYGTRRLSEATGFGRQLQAAYPYYGSATRKLFAAEPSFNYQSGRRLQEAASFVRPLFGNSFVAGAAAADVPVPHFLTRKLTSYGPYYTARRLQTTGGRQLSYYYGQ